MQIAAAYRNSETTLSQRDLLVRLYAGAEKFLHRARASIAAHQYEQTCDACMRAKRIFVELLSTLNFEAGGEIASRLRDLYLFIIGEIVEGNLNQDANRLAGVLPIITTLREAWQGVPEDEADISSLGNTHTAVDIRT